ncbi:zf-HC2 domain-containing protein [Lysobacter sp. LF1]|uniref:Zf-HC2 domain-containing protein n=1 Tax=Lysobacter stagni TaxID=3045172 RepID=A0ABT6XE35_9GAMM|nr:zf-HC2 domain-containing protein [Lysobacter sp. LF1]MDI9238405.1 zf-HC2 domain-containing protein [Lysobacter sp. LF1]
MKILRFEGSAHSEAERLLPWYVNETLDDAEQARVDQHLAQCRQCQREVEFLRGLKSACAEPRATVDPTAAFRRLQDRLRPSRAHSRTSLVGRARNAWLDLSIPLRGAVAMSCVLTLGLFGMALLRDEPAVLYRTLGDAPARGVVAGSDLRHLVVVFDPHIEHARMQQLLRASQARIVDGPNDAGAYVLAVPSDREASVRDALRAAAGVTLVESIDPVERPQ